MIVGFIGLGTMGGSMALNIRKAGYDVIVNDLRRELADRHIEAGCTWGDSIGKVAEVADVIFTSLPGPREINMVAFDEDGLLAGMKPGSAWFDLSTSSPTSARAIHPRFDAKGIQFMDAPVSGGPTGAASGRLAIWVGGDQATFDKHKAILDAVGDQAKYIGPIGAGSVAKLVHNAAGYTIQTALAEVFTMGVKAGVEPLELWDAIRAGANGRARTFDRLGGEFLQNKWDPPSFMLKLAHKDVTLATQLAREVGVPMRLTNMALEELTEAMNRGWQDRDSRVAMLLQEERAGVLIDESAEDVEAMRKKGDF
ncbi:MAG: NAD(P)-dependent oxidoreductase [Dehalococcoidia bacterium]